LALLLVVVVAVVAGGWWMDSSLHRIPALADYPDRPATGKGTILDQIQNRPTSAPELPSSDGTTLPGSPAAPAPDTPQVPTNQ